MRVPLESIQYLIDVFIEGGYAEEEDLDHLDAIHMWLREEEDFQRRAFEKRITRDVNPDYSSAPPEDGRRVFRCQKCLDGVMHSLCDADKVGWVTEAREFTDPAEMPVNRDYDAPPDPENPAENRATYTIVDMAGEKYFFTE